VAGPKCDPDSETLKANRVETHKWIQGQNIKSLRDPGDPDSGTKMPIATGRKCDPDSGNKNKSWLDPYVTLIQGIKTNRG
jgi:hypothetical protein